MGSWSITPTTGVQNPDTQDGKYIFEAPDTGSITYTISYTDDNDVTVTAQYVVNAGDCVVCNCDKINFSPSTVGKNGGTSVKLGTYTITKQYCSNTYTVTAESVANVTEITVSDNEIKGKVNKNTTTSPKTIKFNILLKDNENNIIASCPKEATQSRGCGCSDITYTPSTTGVPADGYNDVVGSFSNVTDGCLGSITLNGTANPSRDGNNIKVNIPKNTGGAKSYSYTISVNGNNCGTYVIEQAAGCTCGDLYDWDFPGDYRYFNMDGTSVYGNAANTEIEIGSFKYSGECTPVTAFSNSDEFSVYIKHEDGKYKISVKVNNLKCGDCDNRYSTPCPQDSKIYPFKIKIGDIECNNDNLYICRMRWRGTDNGTDIFPISPTENRKIIHPDTMLSCGSEGTGADSLIVYSSGVSYVDTENIFGGGAGSLVPITGNNFNEQGGVYFNFDGTKIVKSATFDESNTIVRLYWTPRGDYGEGSIGAIKYRDVPNDARYLNGTENGGGFFEAIITLQNSDENKCVKNTHNTIPHHGQPAAKTWEWNLWIAPTGKAWCAPDGHSTSYSIINDTDTCSSSKNKYCNH